MEKAIPKKGSCGCIGSRKSTRKIPKGVWHRYTSQAIILLYLLFFYYYYQIK